MCTPIDQPFTDDPLVFYSHMYCGFKAVASSYNIIFTDIQDAKLRALCNAIGAVDRIYDNCKNHISRREIAYLIIGSLRGTLSKQSEKQLEKHAYNFWFARLQRSLGHNERMAISVIVEKLFRHFEADRTLSNSGELARSISSQGALTAKLILTAIGATPSAYSRFMTALGAFTNILDSIWDAESDYNNQEINIMPTFSHYLALWKEAASILPSLITIRMIHPGAIIKFWCSLLLNLKLIYLQTTRIQSFDSSVGFKPD
jgi:hypothetical protein